MVFDSESAVEDSVTTTVDYTVDGEFANLVHMLTNYSRMDRGMKTNVNTGRKVVGSMSVVNENLSKYVN